MLQTATVHPTTLAILRKIMLTPLFDQFNLVGGTALALQIGHRISIDLDLFTLKPYDSQQIINNLLKLGDLDILVDKPPFLQIRLDDVKIDFLQFPYPLVQDFVNIDDIRLVSIENIAIMKLLAIARRGVKKDFFDLFFILDQYTLSELVDSFVSKLPNIDMFHILKSLTYFDDAESDADPKMLLNVTWPKVKNTIRQKTLNYLSGK
ncbi:MAG TPA: nucleotidyl transferase AbiEii/AbiGii toxin family protein [Saprospiraceae bacterium]|nr:nucleotidyl transferase AbiEii/AbiGii toxin family protein [Saprospiraceae bacterium]HMQ83445.1 nucleotidyl transferase AbiEii/AbiGii toxin family protein [Saprospiraceae bacterium]